MAFLTLLIERAMQLLTLFTFPYLVRLHEQTRERERDEVINFIFWHTNERMNERTRELMVTVTVTVTGSMKRERGNSETGAALDWG